MALLAMPSGQDELGVGLFDGVLEEAAFEHLSAPFDACFEALGKVGILNGHGQFQAELSLKDQAIVLDLDSLCSDRSLKLLRSTHGDVLRWRGGVAMRALLSHPSQILQIRAQTGDRQEMFRANLTPYKFMDSTNSQSKKGPQNVNVGFHEAT
ncbi:MAG TPA: hypothetical protein VKP69_35085 [Isosphaeraceae bacterium]|nr:hypothetical protein [Isosphaeraceae bacterium]